MCSRMGSNGDAPLVSGEFSLTVNARVGCMPAAPDASICATMQFMRGCICSPTARYLCVFLRARRLEFVSNVGGPLYGYMA